MNVSFTVHSVNLEGLTVAPKVLVWGGGLGGVGGWPGGGVRGNVAVCGYTVGQTRDRKKDCDPRPRKPHKPRTFFGNLEHFLGKVVKVPVTTSYLIPSNISNGRVDGKSSGG